MLQGVHDWVANHPNVQGKKMIARWSRDSALVIFAIVFGLKALSETMHGHPLIEWEHTYGGMVEALAGFLGVLYVYFETSIKEHHQ